MIDFPSILRDLADQRHMDRGNDAVDDALRDAADRISQQDAELERLRREVEEAREQANFAKASDQAGDEYIENMRGAIAALKAELAEARKAAFIEAAEIAYAYECSLADYDGSVDAKHFYEGGVGDASIGISKALRAKSEETGR